jgi:hypothetical protein
MASRIQRKEGVIIFSLGNSRDLAEWIAGRPEVIEGETVSTKGEANELTTGS